MLNLPTIDFTAEIGEVMNWFITMFKTNLPAVLLMVVVVAGAYSIVPFVKRVIAQAL